MERIQRLKAELTPKGRILGDYVLRNPRKVVFMTTKELAGSCGVSEATVVRFVSRLNYGGYGEFIQALRDVVDVELTLLDRTDLSEKRNGVASNRLNRLVYAEIDNLRKLTASLDMAAADRVIEQLRAASHLFVIGSRLSYMLAHFMGWSLMKVRGNIHIMKGSDSTTLDRLTIAPADAAAVIVATSRYPSELLRIGKLVRRNEQRLIVLTDSALCPLIQFAHEALVVPSQHIPVIGNPNALACLINYLVLELAGRSSETVKRHQEKLEQFYRENDILFNLHAVPLEDTVAGARSPVLLENGDETPTK
jgi:DNA-binding MurR/RpiR family transcriptional regulator